MINEPVRNSRRWVIAVVTAGALVVATAIAVTLLGRGHTETAPGPAGPAGRTTTAAVYAAPMDAAGDPHPVVVDSIELADSSAEEAFDAFVAHLAERGALPGPVSIPGFQRVDGLLIAVVELIPTSTDGATDRWYQSFQGSAGARATELLILWNLLQPDVTGAWPDALRLLYRGRPIEPLDHVDLSGLIPRAEVRDR
ncbi:MAG: hypothetical protein EA382_16095 [Spirochaetaceae bacterium]|nr:MAG: hypothetical protein EA382_16095 [Spirochaetaceae bacterium]